MKTYRLIAFLLIAAITLFELLMKWLTTHPPRG